MNNYKNISIIEIAKILGINKSIRGNYHCFNKSGHKNNDKNPSLKISDNSFYCFACGVKGNNIELIKQVLKLNTNQAFDWVNDTFNEGGITAKRQ